MVIGVIDDVVRIEEIFKILNDLKMKYNFNYIFMGMSNDYELVFKYYSDFLCIGLLFKGVI